MQYPEDLVIKALESEARYQAARADLHAARSTRQADLYALWRHEKNTVAVAQHMPPSVTKATVAAAVLRLAPSQDFTQGELFQVASATPAEPQPVSLAA
ncbi:hypothetical protein ACFXPX_36840 [Kitasatospora sp. NPDC059146]|uniref:hypothetical protein n=1 Tax=unclassified Kitasatospora TaxID=2633591 RepID=UPI0036B7CB1B